MPKIIDINGSEREVNSVAPDPTYPGFVRLEYKRHHEWMTFEEFAQKNPDLTHLISAPPPPKDVVGVVTKATKNTLSDASQAWAKDAYLDMWVWLSRGKGEGQKRKVIKNTKNTLTIDHNWDIVPNTSTQFVVSFNVQDSVRPMGNTLPSEDMKALERRAIDMDKKHGRLSSETLKKNIKYLKPEEI